jgi:hypothetical protein
MIKVDLAAAATLVFGAHIPSFKEGTTTATTWRIMLVMMILAIACAFCNRFIITCMQARLMGNWNII